MLALIKNWITRATRGAFLRGVLVLAGGTAFAQALMVVVLPLLTRLYTPEHFSTLAVYAALLALFGSVACLRYEIAISLPEDDRDGAALLILALAFSAFSGALVAVLVTFFGKDFLDLIGHPALVEISWLLPLGVWLVGSYSALQYWTSRKKQFGKVARTRFVQALTGAATQLLLGVLGIAPFGLVVGHFLNSCAGVIGLGTNAVRQSWAQFKLLSLRGVIKVSRQYSRFPRYSTFEALANAGAMQVPLLLIAALAAGPDIGYLLLATRIMAVPMGLIGNSVAQVYLSRAPDEMRRGNLGVFTVSVMSGLIRTGAGPIVFIGILAPFFVPVVFGQSWQRSGEIIAWMAGWSALQFVSSPVSMVLHVTSNQSVALYLQFFGLVFRAGVVLMAFLLAPLFVVEVYAISGFLFYALYLFFVLKKAGISVARFVRSVSKDFGVVLIWVVMAFIVSLVSREWLSF